MAAYIVHLEEEADDKPQVADAIGRALEGQGFPVIEVVPWASPGEAPGGVGPVDLFGGL